MENSSKLTTEDDASWEIEPMHNRGTSSPASHEARLTMQESHPDSDEESYEIIGMKEAEESHVRRLENENRVWQMTTQKYITTTNYLEERLGELHKKRKEERECFGSKLRQAEDKLQEHMQENKQEVQRLQHSISELQRQNREQHMIFRTLGRFLFTHGHSVEELKKYLDRSLETSDS